MAEKTATMSETEYAELMRDVAVWAEEQANLAEYGMDESDFEEYD